MTTRFPGNLIRSRALIVTRACVPLPVATRAPGALVLAVVGCATVAGEGE